MGTVEQFPKRKRKLKSKKKASFRPRPDAKRLEALLRAFDAPVTQAVLFGFTREMILTCVGHCYDYWAPGKYDESS